MKIVKLVLVIIPLILLANVIHSMEEEGETSVSIKSMGERLLGLIKNENPRNTLLFDTRLSAVLDSEKEPLILGFKKTKIEESNLEERRKKVAKLLKKYNDEELRQNNKHLLLLSSYIIQELDEYAKEKDKKQWWSSLKKIVFSVLGSSAFTGLLEFGITNIPNWINNGNSTDVPYSNATMPPGFNGTMFW